MGLDIHIRPHLSGLCGHIHLTPLLVLYNRGSVSVCRAINILVGQSIWHYKKFNDHGAINLENFIFTFSIEHGTLVTLSSRHRVIVIIRAVKWDIFW